jgi:Gas vesicle protein
MPSEHHLQHSLETTSLADLLERVLDKGIVIAGDIKIKLVEVELLTIQLRLVVCSVEKAKELGLDWWAHEGIDGRRGELTDSIGRIEQRLAGLETSLIKSRKSAVARSGSRRG